MSVRDLINAIASGSALETQDAFNSIMSEKISAKLDDMRIDVAKNMFGEACDYKKKMKKESDEELDEESFDNNDQDEMDEAVRLMGRTSSSDTMKRFPKGHSPEGDEHRKSTADMAKKIRAQGRGGEIRGGAPGASAGPQVKTDKSNDSAVAPAVRKIKT